MVEQKDGSVDQSFIINNVLPEQQKAFQQIASEFDVHITVLALAGQKYVQSRLDQQGERHIHMGIVPNGHAQIEIAYSTKNLNNFYDRAGQVLAKMKTSRNKIQL